MSYLYIWGYTVRFHIKSTVLKVYTVGCIPMYTVHYVKLRILRGVYRWVYTVNAKIVYRYKKKIKKQSISIKCQFFKPAVTNRYNFGA